MELISREAAIEVIDELVSTMSVCVSTDECRGMNWMKRRAIAAIEALPTIDPVKHGRWETEVRAIHGYKIPFFACSNCGKNAVEEYRYCPICGARMMEGRADDER